jgi:hypothetical protein
VLGSNIGSIIGSMALVSSLVSPLSVQAGENLFGYVTEADVLPKGALEGYVWMTRHEGKDSGKYVSDRVRLELEYGLSDKWQMSTYVNLSRTEFKNFVDSDGAGGTTPTRADGKADFNSNGFDVSGLQVAFKRMFLSPAKDDFGLSLYLEPGISFVDPLTGEKVNGYSMEAKLILQKYFMDGQLVWAGNITAEYESDKLKYNGERSDAFSPKVTSGLTYRVANGWYAGVEAHLDQESLWTKQDKWQFDHWDLWAGPTIHYGGKAWWATLTAFTQVSGSPADFQQNRNVHLVDHEMRETRLKIGYNF